MQTHVDTEWHCERLSRSEALTRERYLTSQTTTPITSAWEPGPLKSSLPCHWAKRRSSRAARQTLTEQIPNFGHWAIKHPGGRSGQRKREHAKMAQAASSNRARALSQKALALSLTEVQSEAIKPYAGFEPRVGEILADVRYEIGPVGSRLPLRG